jgi:hypothetical protein
VNELLAPFQNVYTSQTRIKTIQKWRGRIESTFASFETIASCANEMAGEKSRLRLKRMFQRFDLYFLCLTELATSSN